MKTISKAAMLVEIVQYQSDPFEITFVKATGKDKGQLTTKQAYYGVPNPRVRSGPISKGLAEKKARKTFKLSNSIPMTEFGSRKLITPHISHIIVFNGKQVIH